MDATEKLFDLPGRSRSAHGGRRRLRLRQGGRAHAQVPVGLAAEVDAAPVAEDAMDFPAAWASKREAELRESRQSEWRHNESALGAFDPETVEERIARTTHETLLKSFEQVPGLRTLYSFDQAIKRELLDPEKCRTAGEPVVHRVLQKLITARLENVSDRDLVCQGPKAGIEMHLSVERLPERRLCLAYAQLEFSKRDGIEIASKRALVLDPVSERFVCQEISRPWADVGSSRSHVADGNVVDDVDRTESPSDLLDVVSAIGLLAEAKSLKPDGR